MAETSKRRGPGQPKGVPFKSDVVQQRISELQLSYDKLAVAMGRYGQDYTATALRNAIKRGTMSWARLKALQLIIQLPFDQFAPEAIKQRLDLDRRHRAAENPTGYMKRMKHYQKSDVKNRVAELEISQRLLDGESVPMIEAFGNSRIFTPASSDEKDRSFPPGFDYNHFLSLAMVLTDRKSDVVIAYVRQLGQLTSSYIHQQGCSIIWATSVLFGLKHDDQMRFDNWFTAACEKPETALKSFIEGPDPPITFALSHRINLTGIKHKIRPMAVITNDQRSSDKLRVYTHYVFECELKKISLDDTLSKSSLIVPPEEPFTIPLTNSDEDLFRPDGMRPNLMDIALLRRLNDDVATDIDFESVKLRAMTII